MSDYLGYAGKSVVVTGVASGMGRATAHQLIGLGAKVYGIDFRPNDLPLAGFLQTDLRASDQIAATSAQIDFPVAALFNCAGLPQTAAPLDVMRVNYLGTRFLTESLISRIEPGGAIASIASTAGLGWSRRLPTLMELIAVDAIDAAFSWCESHPDIVQEGYAFSKELIIAWTMGASSEFIKRGIRINCTLPGPTETPMMREFEATTPANILEAALQPIGRRSSPDEQASALIFLNSPRSSFINGVVLPVDGGFMGGLTTGRIDPAFMMRTA